MRSSLLAPGHDDVGTFARLLLLIAGLASTALAGLLFVSSTKQPWPLAPLHAACLAAMQAAAALPWILAWRERDSAALRIPVAQMLAGSAATLLLTAIHLDELAAPPPAAWAWLVMHLGMAAGAAAWLHRLSDIQAPAERPDRALLLAGSLVGIGALAIAADPALASRMWPWPLGLEPAVLYGGALSGWAVALLKLARERRRGARRLTLWGLVVLGGLVSLASWWYRRTFHHPAAGLAWAGFFVSLTALSWRRLARAGHGRHGLWIRPARPNDR